PARRPVRLPAGDHPRRAARGEPGHAGGQGHRALGEGERVAPRARPRGPAGGGEGRPDGPRDAVGRVPPAARAGPMIPRTGAVEKVGAWLPSSPTSPCAGPTRTSSSTSTTRSP